LSSLDDDYINETVKKDMRNRLVDNIKEGEQRLLELQLDLKYLTDLALGREVFDMRTILSFSLNLKCEFFGSI
jgi:hypothetical protein